MPHEAIEPIPELVVKLLEIGEGWKMTSGGFLEHPTGVEISYWTAGYGIEYLRLDKKNVKLSKTSRQAISAALGSFVEGKRQADMNAAIVTFADRIQQRYGEGRC